MGEGLPPQYVQKGVKIRPGGGDRDRPLDREDEPYGEKGGDK